ncbi:hypothetical protein GEV33_013451 [Tenebrio molitor]|uniref:Uncharacterized protein n=1 Tax=Tenebrio molitor TaxID=7067 RepID=A0A8J6H7V7_TENMO|nr:hypothetical protein GEV33_013451 [Tenebrio molitor]
MAFGTPEPKADPKAKPEVGAATQTDTSPNHNTATTKRHCTLDKTLQISFTLSAPNPPETRLISEQNMIPFIVPQGMFSGPKKLYKSRRDFCERLVAHNDHLEAMWLLDVYFYAFIGQNLSDEPTPHPTYDTVSYS